MTTAATLDDIRQEITAVRAAVRAEADRHDWQDVAQLLEGTASAEGDPVRVVVAGETKRGKSRLVNSIVGRPGLSPVAVDVATSCWVELGHGERDEAVVLLADSGSTADPVRRPIEIFEMERYVVLEQITDPVLGVQVRLPSPVLNGMILVDTPGVGGLHAGHGRITLSALGRADALLFVCDASQPILAPEMDFLIEAAQRITAIIIAVTKSDLSGAAVVAAETRKRVAERPDLAGVPVLEVSAALAENAANVENPAIAGRVAELSGIAGLTAALRGQAETDSVTLRLINAARLTGTVARLLIDRARHRLDGIDGDLTRERELTDRIDRQRDLLGDRARLQLLVQQHLGRLQIEPADEFAARAAELSARYRSRAERGPAAQLSTLAPLLTGDLTAAAAGVLENAAAEARRVMRDLIDAAGGLGYQGDLTGAAALELSLDAPDLPRPALTSALARMADVYPMLSTLVAGSGAIVSVMTGPGVVAACIVVAACAGWWKVRGENEQERRTELGAWIATAESAATASFAREIRRRVLDARAYAETALVGVLTAEQGELTELQARRAAMRVADDRARAQARQQHAAIESVLRPLADRADLLLRRLSGLRDERSATR